MVSVEGLRHCQSGAGPVLLRSSRKCPKNSTARTSNSILDLSTNPETRKVQLGASHLLATLPRLYAGCLFFFRGLVLADFRQPCPGSHSTQPIVGSCCKDTFSQTGIGALSIAGPDKRSEVKILSMRPRRPAARGFSAGCSSVLIRQGKSPCCSWVR